MPVCKYFLQGKCNFGPKCRNEHPQTRSSAFGQSTSQAILKGGSGATGAVPTSAFGFGANRFGALSTGGASSAFGQNTQSAVFGQNTQSVFGQKPSQSAFGQNPSQSAFGQNTQSVFGQNPSQSVFGQNSSQSAFGQQPQTSFSGFNSSNNAPRPFDGGGQKLAAKPLDADQLRKLVTAPLIWKLSSFAPVGEKPSMIVGTDVSPEESRLEFVMAQRQAGGRDTGACQQMFDRLVSDMDRKLEDIAANAQAYAAQWNQLHGNGGLPLGQQQPMQSAFASQNNTPSSVFGQSAFAQNQQQPPSAFGISNPSTASSAFGTSKQATASSAFGGGAFSSSSAFGQNTQLALTKPMSFGNTPQDIMQATGPQRDLTMEEIEYFKAPAFVFGKIPDVPPTPELCS